MNNPCTCNDNPFIPDRPIDPQVPPTEPEKEKTEIYNKFKLVGPSDKIEALKELIKKFSELKYGGALIKALTRDITFQYLAEVFFGEYKVDAKASHFTNTNKTIIYWSVLDEGRLLEELFHAYQRQTGWLPLKGNKEFEAKCLLAYCHRNFDLDYPVENRYWGMFENYIIDPTPENLSAALTALGLMGYIGFEIDSTLSNMIPDLDALINLISSL